MRNSSSVLAEAIVVVGVGIEVDGKVVSWREDDGVDSAVQCANYSQCPVEVDVQNCPGRDREGRWDEMKENRETRGDLRKENGERRSV